MTLGDKAGRGGFPFVQCASGKIENTVARSAVKMVVVFLFGPFIQSAQIRVVDSLDPAAFEQVFKIAVYGCLVEGLDNAAALFEDFFDLERSVFSQKHFSDRIPLNGFSFHFSPSCQNSALR